MEDEYLKKLLIPLPPQLEKLAIPSNHEVSRHIPWTMPAVSLLTPVGYGAAWGDAYMAIGFTNRARFGSRPDAVASAGFGLGDPSSYFGAQVDYSMLDVGRILPWNSAGSIGVKVHRLLPAGFAVALGVDGLIMWNGGDSTLSRYGVVSKSFFLSNDESALFSAIFLSVGMGDGNYRREADLVSGANFMQPFGSASVRVVRWSSIVASYLGRELAAGVSFAPFHETRFTASFSAQDLLGQAGDGVRFQAAFGYSFRFLND